MPAGCRRLYVIKDVALSRSVRTENYGVDTATMKRFRSSNPVDGELRVEYALTDLGRSLLVPYAGDDATETLNEDSCMVISLGLD